MSKNIIPIFLSPKTSMLAGGFYLLTFISIPTLSLYAPLREANFMQNVGSANGIVWGTILEMFMALACIATAVIFYPVLKKQNQVLALGFVSSRILEASLIFMGVGILLTALSLHREGLGLSASLFVHTMVNLYDRIFLISQSFLPVVNGLLLGTLLFQSRLVPRWLPTIGILGAFLLVLGDGLVIFGTIGQHDSLTALFAVPIAFWEFSLGIYLLSSGIYRYSKHTKTR
jgi:hypothetical protein